MYLLVPIGTYCVPIGTYCVPIVYLLCTYCVPIVYLLVPIGKAQTSAKDPDNFKPYKG